MDKELVKYAKKKALRIALSPMKMLPTKHNKLLFHNDIAQNYSANPKYVAQYLIENYPGELELYFSVNNPDKYKDSGIPVKFVKFNSLKYFYHAMTSRVFLTNSGGFAYIPFKKDQHVINTHHGGGAYKTCGMDMYEDTPLFRKDLKLSSSQTELFLSTNRKFTEVVSKAILLPKERFWEIGMPRNDILIHGDEELKEKVRAKLGLEKREKLVLFAPTYRKVNDDYYEKSITISYGLDYERLLNALTKRFGGEWKLAVRYHPCAEIHTSSDSVLDLTTYEEMQELLLVADVLINDFSSSMWDYMLTGKPCFLFATDLENYVNTTKVYTPVEDWPFPKATTNDELEDNILSFDENDYKEGINHHYKALGGCETGRATQLLGTKIYSLCK